MPSCRIWAAKPLCKNRRKYVYYLHMGPPCGFLWRLDASKPLDFHDLLFFATTFSLFFQVDLVFSCRFYEKVLPAYVGSTILDIDTKHFHAKSSSAQLLGGLPWAPRGPLYPSKKPIKTCTVLTFSLFGPTKPAHRGHSRYF